MAEELCKAKELCNAGNHCLYCLMDRLGHMEKDDRCGVQATKALILRQEIAEMVLTASLQVDGFTTEIDTEVAQIRAVHDRLSDQRDKSVSLSTLWTAVGTGAGAVGSALALVGNTAATVGNYVGATGGAVGTFFSFLGYFQQQHDPNGCFPDVADQCPKLNKKEDSVQPPKVVPSDGTQDSCGKESPPLACSPHMLYPLVFPTQALEADKKWEEADKKADKAEAHYWKAWWFHSTYDAAIQTYLASRPPTGWQSRRETLIQPWLKEAEEQAKKKRRKKTCDQKAKTAALECEQASLSPTNTEGKKTCDQAKIAVLGCEQAFLFTTNTDPRKLSIDDLTGRTNKLADLRTVVARMNRDLSRLTEDLARELRCDPKQPGLRIGDIGP